MADQLIIEVSELAKRYNREWIFKNFTQTFRSGQTYAITGPNGSGKSTLLQVLWGQLPQSGGKISYVKNNTAITVDDVFRYVSVAAPYMDLIEEFTLTEQLQFHFKLRKPRTGYTIESMIGKLYMTDSRDKQISNFSSGMKQRVKLGLAFFTETDVIFLDEPGTNLDEKAFAWYKENLAEATQTGSMILIASNQKSEYPDNAEVISMTSYK
ncbi:MAG: ATP-binding cassette domain-containing protein [Cyclobacteriaceae bacterium]|nr:ATP-binding cassette domain-containing protein [Cyclobacteriaceae bacterium]